MFVDAGFEFSSMPDTLCESPTVISSTSAMSSYEEMVHAETILEPPPLSSNPLSPPSHPQGEESTHRIMEGGGGGDDGSSSSCLEAILGTLAEWLLILQGVAEDRDLDLPHTQPQCLKCRCHKAAKITQEMSSLQRIVGDAEQTYDRAGTLEESFMDQLHSRVHEIAVMLRSDVSILIPTTSEAISQSSMTTSTKSSWRGVNPSRWILQSLNGKNNSTFIMDELIGVVTRLLGVDTCDTCNHHFIFCQEEEESDSHLQGVNDKSRKRKQRNPAKLTSPIFNRKTRRLDQTTTGENDNFFGNGFGNGDVVDNHHQLFEDDDPMVAEAEAGINILSLLEKKKKGLKKDGLYKFVLWREALKDEKSKMSV
eukprot:TRINITY_DN5682_c0_g1_i2.p1 TRINITY_DN5682_c0_g1~~TRINITY_DN5682_c0_g1_i2.p1  ORF type:complete len:367 (-),score=83.04 TRINITY_DN5682_c0_g1_i2:167-1267(-)